MTDRATGASVSGHTPVPWPKNSFFSWPTNNSGDAGDNNWCYGFDAGSQLIAEHEANAAFIVRACNSHDELVAALKYARPYVETCSDDPSDLAGIALRNLDAALAKAEAV